MKLIVRNLTDKPMSDVLWYVGTVIRGGRVSDDGKCYCYVTVFEDGTTCSATRNKNSDTIVVSNGG